MEKMEYVDLVHNILGGSIVGVEIKDQLEDFVDLALMEVAPYINTTQFITLPFSPIIDLTDHKIYNVVAVYSGSAVSGSSSATGSGLTDESLLFGSQGAFVMNDNGYSTSFSMRFGDQLAIRLLTRQMVNTARSLTGIDYVLDGDKLYVDVANEYTSEITIEYNPVYKDVEEVTDPYWVQMIYRMTVANAKIALGRIRGKYRSSNIPYDMDADTILQEGLSELESIRSELKESNDIFIFLD